MSPEKIKLLKELKQLENKWSTDFLDHGLCTVEMLKTERDIRSKRNAIKYQDVQENLAIAGLLFLIFKKGNFLLMISFGFLNS